MLSFLFKKSNKKKEINVVIKEALVRKIEYVLEFIDLEYDVDMNLDEFVYSASQHIGQEIFLNGNDEVLKQMSDWYAPRINTLIINKNGNEKRVRNKEDGTVIIAIELEEDSLRHIFMIRDGINEIAMEKKTNGEVIVIVLDYYIQLLLTKNKKEKCLLIEEMMNKCA